MKVPASLSLAFAALLLHLNPAAGAPPARPAEPSPAASPAEVEPAAPAAPAEPAAAPTESDDRDDRPADEGRRWRRHAGNGSVRVGAGYTLEAGETHHEDIVVLGGPVKIAGTQRGDVVVIGGPVEVSGDVDGDMVLLGGPLRLTSSARARRDVVMVGGPIVKEMGATIGGETVEVGGPAGLGGALSHLPFGGMGLGMGLIGLSILDWLKTAAISLLLAFVIAAVLPLRVEAAAAVLRERWLSCLGWGFVAAVAVFPVALLLCLTCVGWVVPVGFYQVAKYFGTAALFVVVGEAIGGTGFRRELSLLPALLLGFVVLALRGLFLPVMWYVYSWMAAGCAILTRFGTLRPWFPGRAPASPTTASAIAPASDVQTP